jgi:sortase (surface protein transpeptidase)
MPPRVPQTSRSVRNPRRQLLPVIRTALIGFTLVCLTACGAAAVTPAGTASDGGGATSVGTISASASAPVSSPADPTAPQATTAAPTTAAPTMAAPAPPAAAAPPAAPAALVLPASAPVSVTVPAIGINSPLIELGRNPDGTVEVPSLDDPDSKPGWYRNSPSPGTLGPAIILGHVDSRAFGPGVFYSLQDLKPGDPIDVARADGTVAEFTVDSVQTVQKSDFPTLQVYGNLDHAGLRLITCGGEFDPNAHSYESNIIVFASLVGSRSA